MSKAHIARIARELDLASVPEDWTGVDAVLPILERMRSERAVVILKLDGERTGPEDNGPYTMVVSGVPLGEDFIRIDAPTMEDALTYVIARYASNHRGIPLPA